MRTGTKVTDTAEHKKRMAQLIRLLIEQRVISSAQAELAVADQQLTGMDFDEVLLARRWVSEGTLYQLAPWLLEEKESESASKERSIAAEKPVDENQLPDASESVSQSPHPVNSGSAAVKSRPGTTAAPDSSTEDSNFQENLKKYYELMDEILGES